MKCAAIALLVGLSTTNCSFEPSTAPTVIASGQSPTSLTTDGTTVYWTNRTGDVMKCAAAGCANGPTRVAASPWSGVPNAVAVTQTDVYWTDGTVWKAPLAGGAPVALASGANAWGLAVTASDAFWTTTSGPVLTCALEGCAPKPVAGGESSFAIAAFGANVYWSDWNAVWTCPLAGCGGNPTPLAAVAGHVALTVDASNVYWAYPDEGLVFACAKSGCGQEPTLMAANQPGVSSLASDGTTVYWTASAGVFSCATTGCKAPTLVAAISDASGIAVDKTGIYFFAGEAVMVARPASP